MNIEWIVEERDVRDLGRRINTGDIVENVEEAIGRQLLDQGVAKIAQPAKIAQLAPEPSAAVPLMITAKQRKALEALGQTKEQIDAMTPQQAQDVLNPATV